VLRTQVSAQVRAAAAQVQRRKWKTLTSTFRYEIRCYDAYISWVRTHHGRRLATTKKGHIGWVPDKRDLNIAEQVEKEDFIVVVFGCSTPLVFRQRGDAYRVVGEAYLEGFMEGELSALLSKGMWSFENFALC
jgi:hypothetical protein